MAEKNEDYQKKMREQMERELQEIEQELGKHPEITASEVNDRIKKQIDKKLDCEIAESDCESILSQLPKEYLEDLRRGRELREAREESAKRRKLAYWKRLAAAVAVIVLVAGIGVTGVGGPKRVAELMKAAVGNRDVEMVTATNDGGVIEVEKDDEWLAYQEIKDELNIDPVRVVVTSDEMRFKSIEIDTDIQMAYLLYDYAGRNVTYIMQCLFSDGGWVTDIEDESMDEYLYELEKTTANVKVYKSVDSKLKKYVARFKYCDAEYQLTATMEEEEFELLLDNLYFW